jgi:hypothetical protein
MERRGSRPLMRRGFSVYLAGIEFPAGLGSRSSGWTADLGRGECGREKAVHHISSVVQQQHQQETLRGALQDPEKIRAGEQGTYPWPRKPTGHVEVQVLALSRHQAKDVLQAPL